MRNNSLANGFKVIIYANQLLRAAFPAMEFAAKTILKNKRSFELEKNKFCKKRNY